MDHLWLFVEFVELSGNVTFFTSVCNVSLCNTSILYTSIFECNVILSLNVKLLMYVSVLMAAFCTFTDIT